MPDFALPLSNDPPGTNGYYFAVLPNGSAEIVFVHRLGVRVGDLVTETSMGLCFVHARSGVYWYSTDVSGIEFGSAFPRATGWRWCLTPITPESHAKACTPGFPMTGTAMDAYQARILHDVANRYPSLTDAERTDLVGQVMNEVHKAGIVFVQPLSDAGARAAVRVVEFIRSFHKLEMRGETSEIANIIHREMGRSADA